MELLKHPFILLSIRSDSAICCHAVIESPTCGFKLADSLQHNFCSSNFHTDSGIVALDKLSRFPLNTLKVDYGLDHQVIPLVARVTDRMSEWTSQQLFPSSKCADNYWSLYSHNTKSSLNAFYLLYCSASIFFRFLSILSKIPRINT